MKISSDKYPIDILILLLWSLMFIPFSLFEINNIIRIVIGLPIIIFIPGYFLTFLLFPFKKIENEGINNVERLTWSFALSLAIIPITGLILNSFESGLNLYSIVFLLESFIIFTGLFGIYRWQSLPTWKRHTFSFNLSFSKKNDSIDKLLSIILIISLVVFSFIMIYVLFTPFESEPFSEFYLLSSNGDINAYPQDVYIGENVSIKIGVVNHEFKTIDYTVIAMLEYQDEIDYDSNITANNTNFVPIETIQTSLESVPFDVNQAWQKQWEYNLSFNPLIQGKAELHVLLFRGSNISDYYNYNELVNLSYLIVNLSLNISNLPKITELTTTPTSIFIGDSVNISSEIFDADGIDDVYLVLYRSGRFIDNISITNFSNIKYYYNFIAEEVGTFNFYFYVKDYSGNATRSDISNFLVMDVPIFSDINSSQYVISGNTTVNFTCIVQDFDGIENVSLILVDKDNQSTNISIINNRINDSFYYNTSFIEKSEYLYYFWARDMYGNMNVSSTKEIFVDV